MTGCIGAAGFQSTQVIGGWEPGLERVLADALSPPDFHVGVAFLEDFKAVGAEQNSCILKPELLSAMEKIS